MGIALQPADVEILVRGELRPGEVLLAVLPGLGASLGLTSDRVVILRAGGALRPRSGVRSWEFAAISEVTATPPSHGQGRVLLRSGTHRAHAVSIFFEGRWWPDAQAIVRDIRTRSLLPPRSR